MIVGRFSTTRKRRQTIVLQLLDEYGDDVKCFGCKGPKVLISQRLPNGSRYNRSRFLHDVSCVARSSDPDAITS